MNLGLIFEFLIFELLYFFDKNNRTSKKNILPLL